MAPPEIDGQAPQIRGHEEEEGEGQNVSVSRKYQLSDNYFIINFRCSKRRQSPIVSGGGASWIWCKIRQNNNDYASDTSSSGPSCKNQDTADSNDDDGLRLGDDADTLRRRLRRTSPDKVRMYRSGGQRILSLNPRRPLECCHPLPSDASTPSWAFTSSEDEKKAKQEEDKAKDD